MRFGRPLGRSAGDRRTMRCSRTASTAPSGNHRDRAHTGPLVVLGALARFRKITGVSEVGA
ncbi:hypothetical protein A8926_1545 [Saccharopolyspora spinosa]|uniref:Uncharacterized protein n=1 Tax=Saccharopolyspora spinosa TaxID=60894 RepID=A0A2N3XTJ1_SACSN|nr:hypothetical protein A8926_1545 [Saccharopolyspora spinosa]